MHCGRAQTLMPAAVDGELRPWRWRRLERHLAGCDPCRHEMAGTETVLAALAGLPSTAPVSAGLEQRTLRQVRLVAAEEADGSTRTPWWRQWTIPTLACAAAAMLAVVLAHQGDAPIAPAVGKGTQPQVAKKPRPPIVPELLTEPPPALAAAPELFMDLPILRHMEKLEHFEAIETTTVGDDVPGAGGDAEERSSG